ncbi:MAG: carboxypeptidase regulatory-like domain-containing protein [Paludibacteraceae bacterium]|nr:carboxypeptidase regulatory-like domain-containing protein [Paludibacteraceae bacterium]
MRKLTTLILLALIVIFAGCKNNNELYVGSVYGTIIDKATGKAIRNAGVELMSLGLKTVTGDDGQFEFAKVEEGKYNLFVTKSGYKDFKSNDIVVRSNNENKPVSIQIEKLPPSLTIVDDSENVIDAIDFSSDDGVVMKSFNIFNNGEEVLEWSIAFQCTWIKAISKIEGSLKANATQSIVITIDRSKLNVGDNSTIFQIVSNNGSKQLNIRASGLKFVETSDATDIGITSAVINASIIRNTEPAISEYGFVYSKSPAPSVNNGAIIVSIKGSPKIGSYNSRIEELEENGTYYVRAFIKYADEVVYGKQITFSTIQNPLYIGMINQAEITPSSINISCEVESNGVTMEEVGVCWGTEVLPTKEKNYQQIGTGRDATAYSTSIYNLTPNTQYHVRFYARNIMGEKYSTDYSFTTKVGTPKSVEILSGSSNLESISLSCSSKSDFPIVRQGICYSRINNKPTLGDMYVVSESKHADFSCTITDLDECSKYYVRAFAENMYGITYSSAVQYSTQCKPAVLKGHVYDQDGNPLNGAIVREYGSSTYKAVTDNDGYYEIKFGNMNIWCDFSVSKDNYESVDEKVYIYTGKETIHDFYMPIITPFAVDPGAGRFINPGQVWMMTFDCHQISLAGKNTTRNLRIKNNRSVSVPFNISSIPTSGVQFSPGSGNIPANSEVSISVKFIYPSTTAQVVQLSGCATGKRTYLWNWEDLYSGVYLVNDGRSGYYGNDTCSACCLDDIYITVGSISESLTLVFNQFAVW